MRIYLDNNATTRVDPSVLEAMLPYLREDFANASSVHSPGQRARAAVDEARESVAALLNSGGSGIGERAVKASEIVFTSDGTEADNLAVFGVVAASPRARKHVITTSIEHHAVLQACQALETQGVDVTYLPANGPAGQGVIDPAAVRAALRPETVLISVMHANNELGTVQPVDEIGRIAQEAAVPFHCDAVQSAGKLPLDANRIGASLLALSAHKIYGPKGAGALYVHTGTRIEPLRRGGQHERGLRPGTENVPAIVGMGKAAELAANSLREDAERIANLRDHLESELLARVPGIRVNRWSSRSTCRASPARPARRVRPARSSRRTCCSRSASVTTRPAPASVLASAATQPLPKSIAPLKLCRKWPLVCVNCLRARLRLPSPLP